MAGAAAAIGDDCRGALHYRLPVRISHVGNEHVAALHARHFLHVTHDARRTCADALADAAPACEHSRALLQREALDRAAGAALHGLRTRLQDIDLAGLAILAPFDVHRAAVVLFDDQRLPRQLEQVLHRRGETQRGRLRATSTVCTRSPLPGRRVHHLDRLARRALRRRICLASGAQRGLVDVELIGIDRALHDGLAEAVGGRDEDDVAETRVGVEREHHAAGAEIAPHHVLHAGRQRDLVVSEALMHAIGDGAIVEQRRVILRART